MRERFGKGLSENEFAVAEAIETMGFASTSEVMMAVGLSERGVQGVLKRLAERGVVLRTGAGRSTRYKLADYYSVQQLTCFALLGRGVHDELLGRLVEVE